MQLLYGNELVEINNNVAAINKVFKKVNKELKNKDIIFSHLIIDGVEVYENHEQYIKDHLNDITTIEIAMRNVKEMIWETMLSIHSYLQRAIPALTELVDQSYEKFSTKSWEGIDQLAEGMQWFLQFFEVAKSTPQQPSNWLEIEKSMKLCETSFAQLLEAVEAKDTILMTDILTYEITPAYQSLKDNIAISLEDEEYLKNVN